MSTQINPIVQILMDRDNMSREDAEELLVEARANVNEGDDPEEVLYDYFNLEPDYIDDLLE